METKHDGHSSFAPESQKHRNHGVFKKEFQEWWPPRENDFHKREEAEVGLVEKVMALAQFSSH